MSITNFLKYCKSFLDKRRGFELYMTIASGLLVGEVFIYGVLLDKKYNWMRTEIIFNENKISAVVEDEAAEKDRKIVASKSGKRYYFEHCSGVKRIKEVNKIYFISENAAKATGLTLASGCR